MLFSGGVGSGVGVCAGVSTDSRSVRPGELFVALTGETFDGHSFVQNALRQGAAAAVVGRERQSEFPEDAPLIAVENTLDALGKLARFHRDRFDIPVVAIAGAAGKTSTKDLAAHLLASKFAVLKTEKNYNNRIGVPMTLLQLGSRHTAAVIEAGTNEPGEIAALAEILRPTHGLITNIGKEHLEKLGDLDGVEREECALFGFLARSGGTALVNLDDARLKNYAPTLPRVLSFGMTAGTDVRAEAGYDALLRLRLTLHIAGETAAAAMQTVGHTAALNAVAAAAAGAALGMTAGEIAAVFGEYSPPPAAGYGRMNIEQFKDVTLINDCYNANPESVAWALRTLRDFAAGRKKIAVLGDMRELGQHAAAEHDAILREAAAAAGAVIAVGAEMTAAADRTRLPNVATADKKQAANIAGELAAGGAVILVKGSRGIAMEDVIGDLHTILGT